MTQNKPLKQIREGVVKASIFEREVQASQGKFISKSIALQIGFKNKDGQWENRNLTVIEQNLPKVISVLNKVAGELDA